MDDIKDKTKEQIDFDKWLASCTTKFQGVDVLKLVKISRKRHSIAHTDSNSVTAQKEFLESCDNFNFTGDDVKQLASQLLPILKQQKLKRKKYTSIMAVSDNYLFLNGKAHTMLGR